MSRSYRFQCGCTWPIVRESDDPNVLPLLDIDTDLAPEDCPATWELLGQGRTKGVFQLESPLGRIWSKKLKPESYEHMTALGALLRPGCLKKNPDEEMSMTQRYVLRRHGGEPVAPYHPAVDPILEPTYGCLTFQEQSLKLAIAAAGFTEQEADSLRKAAAKKLPEEMAKCKTMFLEGAAKIGVVTTEQAEELFSWIEKSQRYAFNRCLSDNQTINLVNGQRITAKELYETFHSGGDAILAYSMVHTSRLRGRLVENEVVDVRKEGVHGCVLIVTESGGEVRATHNHKFPTPEGDVRADQLVRGTKLFASLTPKAGGEVFVDRVAEVLFERGLTEVYDVEMRAPHHNFLTDGIVTCNSHAACYGVTGYRCAYLKAHHPLAFFAAWLRNARLKKSGGGPLEEVFELVNDARLFDVAVEPPDLRSPEELFHTDGRVVRFGLANVKGIGKSAHVTKEVIRAAEASLGRPLATWSWLEFLAHAASHIPAGTMGKLIEAGATRWTGMSRAVMLEEYKVWAQMTAREQDWVREKTLAGEVKDFRQAVRLACRTRKEGGPSASAKRSATLASHLSLLEKPASPIVDVPLLIANTEEQLLGISLTHASIDSCDTSAVNASCKEFASGRSGFIVLGVKVQSSKELKTKTGKNAGSRYGRLTVGDGSCSIEALCWSETWEEYGHLLTEGNHVILQVERDYKDPTSPTATVRRAFQASAAASAKPRV